METKEIGINVQHAETRSTEDTEMCRGVQNWLLGARSRVHDL